MNGIDLTFLTQPAVMAGSGQNSGIKNSLSPGAIPSDFAAQMQSLLDESKVLSEGQLNKGQNDLIAGLNEADSAQATAAPQRTLEINSELQEKASEFEAIFLSMMLKEMRNTLDSKEGGLFSGEQSDTYGGMFDMFMSQHLAKAKPLGIGAAVESYLNRSLAAKPAEEAGQERAQEAAQQPAISDILA